VATEPESLLPPPNGHTRGLIFDFDGTLVDSYPLIEAAFAHVMQTHRLDEAARALFRQSRGLPLPEQMKMVAPDMWEELVATYRSIDASLGHARVFRGIPTLVKKLHQAGAPLGVVSCKRRALVEGELEAAGLRAYFDVVIGYEDVTPPKPAPDPYLEACRRLGVEPGPSVVALEDSPTGVAAARAAGLTVIGVPSIEGVALEEAHHIAESLRDEVVMHHLAI